MGLQPTDRVDAQNRQQLYSPAVTQATYTKLYEAASEMLTAGYSVILDATFLKLKQRRMMHDLANRLQVGFAILDCPSSDHVTLKQRLRSRLNNADDPSDADESVLEAQLASREPLTESEKLLVSEQ